MGIVQNDQCRIQAGHIHWWHLDTGNLSVSAEIRKKIDIFLYFV